MKRIPKSDYYDSHRAAALAFGLTLAELHWCRDNGAPTKGHRIQDKPFRAWLRKNRHEIPKDLEQDDLNTLKKRHIRCKIEAHEFDMEVRKFDLAKDRGEYVRIEAVRATWTGYVEDLKRYLHDFYETQLPPKQVGLTAPELSAIARDTNADIVNRLRYLPAEPSAAADVDHAA